KETNSVLLDVRTSEELSEIGRPDGEKIGLKTYFLPIKSGHERSLDKDFIKKFKELNIAKDQKILIICRSGIRSQLAAELLVKENYNCINILDGFEGNCENVGWKEAGLPC
ncbi:rhodanese-like domain-containing protein, partial [Candidatus Pelagibacter ubique]|nr:rhodanese-like domain-containing protein [Candidatus Pelagibacter ubique]